VTFAARIRAYAELSRLSNVPTVASGALAGTALGAHAHADPALLGDWRAPLTSALACCGFYVAGMALNDLVDRTIDRDERPHRPIPSGRVAPRGAATFASVLVVGGLFLLSFGAVERLLAAIALVFCIVLYNAIHARTRASIAVMGACRGLVLVVGALAFGLPPTWTPIVGCALLLAVFVAGLSLVARGEADAAAHDAPTGNRLGPTLLAWTLLAAAIVVPPSLDRPLHLVLAAVAAGCILAWHRIARAALAERPPRIGAAVVVWIASISLFDAYVALLSGSIAYGVLAFACFPLVRFAQRRIAGT
jgi:4-hydroxybenzoate polyprenyltransferase